MQITVDLAESQLAAIDKVGAELEVSRVELIQQAIGEFLQKHSGGSLNDLPGFGCWSKHSADGLEYQRQIRKEWDR